MSLLEFHRPVVALALAMLAGCTTSGELGGFAATLDSDTLAPSFAYTSGDESAQTSQPPGPRGDRAVYYHGDRGLPIEGPTSFGAPCSADCERPHREWTLEEPLCASRDFDDFVPSLGRDLGALATWHTAGILLAGGAASLAIRETVDDDVADWTAENPNRWGEINDVIGAVGNPGLHFAAAAALWGTSLTWDDPELHSLSGSLMNALVITGASTLALKLIADTDAPNDEDLGWPSGHTSSSVTVAAVLDEYYGPWVGVPAYLVAGAVAWERIDDREHDLSDVIFGAALGYVVGKVVAHNHLAEQHRPLLVPYVNPLDGSPGVGLEIEY
jgi:membrane-associated phospholipid phosphatase